MGTGILFSALLQVGASLTGLFQIYSAYSQRVSDTLAEVTIEAAVESGSEKVRAAPAMALGALTPLGFFAVSHTAWILAYAVFSGVVRLIGYASDHPCGDPVLTFIDNVVWDTGRSVTSSTVGLFRSLTSWWTR